MQVIGYVAAAISGAAVMLALTVILLALGA